MKNGEKSLQVPRGFSTCAQPPFGWRRPKTSSRHRSEYLRWPHIQIRRTAPFDRAWNLSLTFWRRVSVTTLFGRTRDARLFPSSRRQRVRAQNLLSPKLAPHPCPPVGATSPSS